LATAAASDQDPVQEPLADPNPTVSGQPSQDAGGATVPAPPTVIAAAPSPPPAPAATQANPPANPVPAPSSAITAAAATATAAAVPTDAASAQANTAPLAVHAGRVSSAHGQAGPKAASTGTAKIRSASSTDSRHADTGGLTPSDEGDGTEPHTLQAVTSGSSAIASSPPVDVRGSAAAAADASQVTPLVVNPQSPDATPDNQAPVSAAVQGVHAAGGASGAAASSASTQDFANLVGVAADKHAVAKADAAGGGVDAGGALQSLSQTSTASAPDAPAAAPTFKVGPGVDSAEFGQGVANQVSMMVDSNITSAKLQVSPPALGPIEVRIALQGDHASVQFTSHSAVTREALADSTPKLRDMLSSQGFGQVSVDISHRSFQERPSNAQAYEWGGKSDAMQPAPTAASASLPVSRVSRSAVDAYA
jgi:flagellar hook-length control protein FliK